MASFFFYLIVIVVSFLLGGVSIFLLLGFFGLLNDLFKTKGIPRGRKKFTEYLKNPEIKEKFNYPGKPTEQEKEVKQENERKRADKYREFERLRRAELKARIGKNQNGEPSIKGSEPIQQQPELLPNKFSGERNNDSPRSSKPQQRISLYD